MRSGARFTWRILAGLAVSLTAGGTAWSQSIYGPGGLFLSPTADFPAKGETTPALLVIPQDSAKLGGRRTWASYTLDYGVSDRLEVGVTHLDINPSRPPFQDGSTGGFAKYRLIEGKAGIRPDVAVGAGFLGGGDADAQVGFIALRFSARDTKPHHAAHLHLGLLYAEDLNGVTRQDLVPYGGVDYELSRNLILFAEMRALMDAKPHAADLHPPRAFGVVWRPARYLKVAVAYANNGWSSKLQPSFGIGYKIAIRR
jgi:hypothetical protein